MDVHDVTKFAFLVLFALGCLAFASLPADGRAGVLADPGLAAKVDALFAKWHEAHSPGCAVAILHNGQVVYQKSFGRANLEHDVPNRPSTRFQAGSMAKHFTAACVELLVQEGKVVLDAPVRRYVPELPQYDKDVTVRQLLHHTSGLREMFNLLTFAGWRWGDAITETDLLAMITRQRELNHAPGEEFLYSNTNYFLLGELVKRVTGQSLRAFAEQRLFRPLGMQRTLFLDDHDELLEGRASGYRQRATGGFERAEPGYDFAGPTNLYVTVEDLAKWDAHFYEPRIGGQPLLTRLLTPGRLNDGTVLGYAGGLHVGQYRGLAIVSSSGTELGYRCELLRFPNQRFTVAILANLYEIHPTHLARQIADLYLAKDFPEKDAAAVRGSDKPETTVKLTAAQLEGFEGTYWNDRIASKRRFQVQNGQLQMMTPDPFALVPIGERTFLLPVAPKRYEFTFVPPDAGNAMRVVEKIAGEKPVTFTAVVEVKPQPAELAEYAGAYVSEELGGITWTLEVKGGKLVMHGQKFRDRSLEPICKDVFEGGLGSIRFHRSKGSRVDGLAVSTERIRRLGFRRIE